MENQYDTIMNKIWRGCVGLLSVGITLGLIVFIFWIAFATGYFGMIFLLLPITISVFIACGLDIGIGIGFKGYRLKNTGWVLEGDTQFVIVRSKLVLKRRMIYSYILAFIELLLFILCFIFVWNQAHRIYCIFGLVESLLIGVFSYLIAQKTRIDLKNGNYETLNKN